MKRKRHWPLFLFVSSVHHQKPAAICRSPSTPPQHQLIHFLGQWLPASGNQHFEHIQLINVRIIPAKEQQLARNPATFCQKRRKIYVPYPYVRPLAALKCIDSQFEFLARIVHSQVVWATINHCQANHYQLWLSIVNAQPFLALFTTNINCG